mmetsp:Transcript_50627/g.164058  ORF Transcript_50627/g.164058 Transcript_50627/m.164058 type:complete len:331 (-) Transcript_50627:7-999(-)
MHRVEPLEEAEGAIVERHAGKGRIVRVHVALAVADAQPLCHKARLPLADLAEQQDEQPRQRRLRLLQPQVCKVAAEGVHREGAEEGGLVSLVKELKLAEAEEGGRHPRTHRPRLKPHPLPALRVVPRPLDRVAARHDREGARRRDAEVVHRLASEKLSHRGAEHGPPVEAAAEGRGARTLELHLEPVDLADGDGTPVAPLPAVPPREASAIRGCPTRDRFRDLAREKLQKLVALAGLSREAERGGDFGRVGDEAWRRRRHRRTDTHVVGASDLSAQLRRLARLVRHKLAEQRIVDGRWPVADRYGGYGGQRAAQPVTAGAPRRGSRRYHG